MDFNLKEAIFATAAGLRGSVSLILTQAVITELHAAQPGPDTVSQLPSGFSLADCILKDCSMCSIIKYLEFADIEQNRRASSLKLLTHCIALH